MLYCKKCDRDYEETLELCPVCGSVLMQKATDEEDENHVPVASVPEEIASRITEFFQYSGLNHLYTEYDSDSDSVKILVNESDYQTAVKLLHVFNNEESKRHMEEELAQQDAEKRAEMQRLLLGSESKAFVKSADKYEDLRSSAFSLIPLGILLLIGEVFYALGMIPLNLNIVSKILMHLTLAGMGIGFVIAGISAYRKANSIKGAIREEDDLTREILDWFLHTYTTDDLDGDIDETLEEGETIDLTERQFRRLDLIKNYINTEYDIPDDSFVDALSETVYQGLYEN